MTALQITLYGIGALMVFALALALAVLALCVGEEVASDPREYDLLARDYYQRSWLAHQGKERWG